MNKIKKYMKPLLYWTFFLVLYLVVLSTLNYFQVIKMSTILKINIVVIALFIFILGISFGKKSSKKGYIEGLKLGSIIIVSLFLIDALFIRKFNLNILSYYFMILVSSTFGSMIGINIKK